MDSSQGSATATPRPRTTVRREMDFVFGMVVLRYVGQN
jgi:hypothetical protein